MDLSILTARKYRAALLIILALCSAGLQAQLTVTLTGSMHNGTSVPCFGMKDGTIQSTVSGGTPPYTYNWSNGATTPTISGVAAGYYKLGVEDAQGATGGAEITLTEPEPLKADAVTYKYPNGLNISCYNCYNGSIDVVVSQGTPPYSYVWDDGPVTTQDRTGLGAKQYSVLVTDVNGCTAKASGNLSEPERTDWGMTGNAGTNPATQYIGTSDSKDVVFKANGQEALRLKSNGGISLMGSLTGDGPLFRDADGALRVGDPDDYQTLEPGPCNDLRPNRYWKSWGNAFVNLCPEEVPRLGTVTNHALRIITNDEQRMVISKTGKVGIGTEPTGGNVEDYRLSLKMASCAGTSS